MYRVNGYCLSYYLSHPLSLPHNINCTVICENKEANFINGSINLFCVTAAVSVECEKDSDNEQNWTDKIVLVGESNLHSWYHWGWTSLRVGGTGLMNTVKKNVERYRKHSNGSKKQSLTKKSYLRMVRLSLCKLKHGLTDIYKKNKTT